MRSTTGSESSATGSSGSSLSGGGPVCSRIRSSSAPAVSHVGSRPRRQLRLRQCAAGEGCGSEQVGALDGQPGGEPGAVGEPGCVHALRVDREPLPEVAHDVAGEADVVRGPGRAFRVAGGLLVERDLLLEVEVVPLRRQAAALEHAVPQAGREHGHEPGRVGLLAPAGRPEEPLPRARAAVEHEHDGPQRAGHRPPARHVDDETARVAVDLDRPAIDAGAVRDADGALRDAGAGRQRTLAVARAGLSRRGDRRGEHDGAQQGSVEHEGAPFGGVGGRRGGPARAGAGWPVREYSGGTGVMSGRCPGSARMDRWTTRSSRRSPGAATPRRSRSCTTGITPRCSRSAGTCSGAARTARTRCSRRSSARTAR